MLLVGCNTVPVGGTGELEDEFNMSVVLTNVGTGSGSVGVVFSIGDVQDPCPAVLGPGEACSPSATSLFKVESVTLEAIALDGNDFLGWGVLCSGVEETCTLTNDSRELDVQFEVTVQFDLTPAG